MMYRYNRYPTACLGELGADFAQCVANNAQAKYELVGPVILSAMSSAVHAVLDIQTPMHSIMPSSLNVCVVAGSGMRKSTVTGRAFHGFKDFEDRYARIAPELDPSEERVTYSDLGSHPYILEDASEPGIVDHFANGAKAAAIVMDEGGMLQARLDNQRMCKRFDGADLRVIRHRRTVLLRNTRTTFCMTVQDEVMDNLLKGKQGQMMVGSGAIPRMLISYATKAPAFFNLGAGERSNPFEHPFHDRVRELMTDYKDVLQGYADREQVTLSLQAQECLRHAVSVWKSLPLGDERWKGMDAFVHRAGEQAMRVAAVLQCFNDPLPTVQGVTMEAAVTLVDWHLEQALIGFGEPSEDQLQLELGAELYRYILKRVRSEDKTVFDRSELLRCGPKKLRNRVMLDRAIDQILLEDKMGAFPSGTRKQLVLNVTPNPRPKTSTFANFGRWNPGYDNLY